MYLRFICIFFLFTVLKIEDIHAEVIYAEECEVWKNVTELVKKEPRLNVTCQVNKDCTGFDCNGDYTYNGLITGNEDVVRHVCFGVFIHPCSHPLNMTVYIEVWERHAYNVSYVRTINHDHKEDIPGVEERVRFAGSNMVRLTAELDTKFETHTRNGKKYATISMVLQPEIHLLWHEERPGEAKVVMVPEVEVSIPPCKANVKEITHTPYVCPELNNTGYRPPKKEHLLPGTPCSTVNLGACDNHQACKQKAVGSNDGLCVCISGYIYKNSTNACEAQKLTTTTIPTFDDDVTATVTAASTSAPKTGANSSADGKSKSKKNVFAIIGGVGAVFIVAVGVALALILYRYKRRRSNNEDQELVANEEQDDDPIAL